MSKLAGANGINVTFYIIYLKDFSTYTSCSISFGAAAEYSKFFLFSKITLGEKNTIYAVVCLPVFLGIIICQVSRNGTGWWHKWTLKRLTRVAVFFCYLCMTQSHVWPWVTRLTSYSSKCENKNSMLCTSLAATDDCKEQIHRAL